MFVRPTKPALPHGTLNVKVTDWQPERYQRHYECFATPSNPGIIEVTVIEQGR